MQKFVLVLTGAHRSPRLASRAVVTIDVADRVTPEVIARIRQYQLPVLVAGPAAAAVVSQLADLGLPAAPAPAPEPGTVPAGMTAVDDVLDLIGGTPLVRLDRLYSRHDAVIVGKLESQNPGGSIKDRVAVSLVDQAEHDGALLPGGHIVEPTSGNTGVGLAIVAARRGYRCTFTVPDKVAPEKIALLRAYGADVVVCPTAVAPEHPDSYYSVARRIAEGDPKAFRPDQYANPANPRAHVLTTGPEIWEQTAGRVTHIVAGAGTGGTLGGIGTYLKARNPDIRIVAADPVGSVYSGGSGEPYLVEGIGEDFWPANWNPAVVDDVVPVSDAEAFHWTRAAARQEGLLVGGSCGAALAAADAVAAGAGPDAVIVVILPDGGRGYLSKVYDDTWMLRHGFIEEPGEGIRVRDAVATISGRRPSLVHVHPDETVSQAARIIAEYGVTAIPVVAAENPRVPSQVVGSVTSAGLAELLHRGYQKIGNGEPPLPLVGAGQLAASAVKSGAERGGMIVVDEGRPVAVLSVAELLRLL